MLQAKLVQGSTQYQKQLQSEIDGTMPLKQILLHGPDTVECFEEFSMQRVIGELQLNCPETYKLVQLIGSTERNAKEGVPDEELKGVMALCTILNTRSARMKGVQMISLMLVGNRQVYKCVDLAPKMYAHVHNNNIIVCTCTYYECYIPTCN